MTTHLNLNGRGGAPAATPQQDPFSLGEGAPAAPTPQQGPLPSISTPDVEPVIVDADPIALEKIQSAKARGDLKPLVADWLTDRSEFVGKVAYVGKVATHTTLWHILHSPMHAGRIAMYAPRGLLRVVKAIWAWTLYHEVKTMRREFAANNDGAMWTKLAKERTEHIHRRWIGLLVMLGFALLVLTLMYFFTPNWTLISSVGPIPTWHLTTKWLFGLMAAGAGVALGYVGRPLNGKSLIPAASSVHGDMALTNDSVINALCSLGIARLNKPEEIDLLYGVKPARAGYNIDLTLPKGVEATEVMEKRGRLSSGLQRPIDTVWPSVGERHHGHLVLFISHEGMSSSKQKQWPLLKQGTVDLFKPVPMFTDQRGDWVSITIATKSGVVGAIPRMGKTYFLRELGLVAGLDVRAEVYTFELKGTGDMSSHKLFAHYYSDSDEEEDIKEHLKVMEGLRQERRRRSKVIKDLPNERSPRSEVDTMLASDRKLRLHPIVVIIDECQTWTEHAVKAIAEQFCNIIEELVRKGPAVGIQVFLATQKVDAKSIPTHISNMATIRLCFKVEDWQSNNQILGPGSYANGNQATMFDFEKDKGVAYLKDGGAARIVRTVAMLDKIESEKVALRARAIREIEGRLTGAAAGEEMENEEAQVVLLDDVRRVVGNADTMHLTDLVKGLATLRPTTYGHLNANTLGGQLKKAEVQVASVYVASKSDGPRDKRSARGVKREWLNVSTTRLVGDEEPTTDGVED